MNTIATKIISLINNEPLVVGICGGSASGKSTYSISLSKKLEELGCSVTVINQDDFAIGRHFAHKNTSPYRWDDPDNYRLQECLDAVISLRSGSSTTFLAYTLKDHEPKIEKSYESLLYSGNPYVIIVEGIFAWYKPMDSIVDYKIYLDADFFKRFVLRLHRNVYESKHADIDTVIKQYFTHVAKAEHALLMPMKSSADTLVANHIPLPKPGSESESNSPIDYIIHDDPTLTIGISSPVNKPPLMIIKSEGNVLYRVPINAESMRILMEYSAS